MAVLTRKTGQGTELSEEAARATWQRWQAEFDINKDGKISYKELAEWGLKQGPGTRGYEVVFMGTDGYKPAWDEG